MKKLPKRTLVYDVSNILFRVAAVQKHSPYTRDSSTDELVGLCMHISLMSIFKWYNKFRPDFVVFGFEGGNNWRKTYTAETRTRLQYKGNRVQDPEMKHFYMLMEAFRETMSSHTSICCLSIETMEADDVIAGFCQLYAAPEHEILIVSGDRDFTQLLKLPNVKLVNPDNGKFRNSPGDKDYESDIDYWLFKKCVRGDMGDYVPSAFPRVRETRIKAAYTNDYERVNFMNEKWTEAVITEENGQPVQTDVIHRVGDLFEHNVILLDLFKQPSDQRLILEEGVKMQVENLGTYSHFHFLRFLKDFQLQKVSEDAMRFIDLFANNQRFLKGEKPTETIKTKPATVNQPAVQSSKLLDF